MYNQVKELKEILAANTAGDCTQNIINMLLATTMRMYNGKS